MQKISDSTQSRWKLLKTQYFITKNKTILLSQAKWQGNKTPLKWIKDKLTEFWIFELSESKEHEISVVKNFLYTLLSYMRTSKNWLQANCSYFSTMNQSRNVLILFFFGIGIICFARRVFHISKVIVNIMYLAFIHANSFSDSCSYCRVGEG